MTIEESTAWALTALKAGDLGELARAVEARRVAIAEAVATRQPPPPHILAQVIGAGERICGALEAVKREVALETARLQCIHKDFSSDEPRTARFSLRG